MGEKVAYPENYPVEKGYGINLNCSWKISGIAGYDIVVYPKWTCEVDAFFRLYYAQTTLTKTDGCVGCPRSDGYCNEIIRTGSSEILLTLRTSSPYKEGGFQFRFMSVEKKKIDTCDSTDRTLVAESTPKFITSPGFPSEYQSELHCSWRVKPAFKKKDIRLVFEFRSQYLEKSIDVCIDYVKIESIGEFCEDSENNIFRTSGRMLLNDTTTKVQFVSDIGFGGSGFVLAFYVEDKVESCSCQHGGSCLNSTCICPRGYKGSSCEIESLKILSFRSNNVLLREGKPVWFELETVDNNSPSVQWFRSGIGITSASLRYVRNSFKAPNGSFFHMLNISHVMRRDEGNWTVEVSNGVTTAYRSIHIRVLPRLLLQMTPQYDFSTQSGESLNLQCTVINPESLSNSTSGSLIWQKDGNNIARDSKFNISTTNISTTLRKTSAGYGDSGSYLCSHSSYPDPTNVSVNIIVTKPEQIRCPNTVLEGITWNATIAGTTKRESCPKNKKGTATRFCNTRGEWEIPSLINCTDEGFVNASKELDVLIEDGVNNSEQIKKTIDNTLVKMKNLTSQSNALSAGDISSSLDIIEKIVNVTNMTSAKIKKEVFFEVVDNVLSTSNTESWTTVQDKTEKDATLLLKNMDRLSEVILRSDNITTSTFTGKNFEVTVDQTNLDENGIIFPERSSNNTNEPVDEIATFLQLPMQANKSEKAVAYVAVIYRTISEILRTHSEAERDDELKTNTKDERARKKEIVNSEILSLTTQTDLGFLFPPLNLTFQHLDKNKSGEFQASCVSWNFTLKKWSEKGCKVNSTNDMRTVCQCNHLTNFAILMRPYTSEKEDKASLKTLSFVGVIISIAFTVITFIIYIVTWKHIKNDQNIMLLNLCGSLILSYVVFISAVEETNSEGLCIAITAIIHYLFLVTFFCMMGMGVYYFMSITVTYYALYMANNFKSKSRVHWFLFGGWGIPLIIVASTLGAFWGNKYHVKNYCWLSMESGSLYLFIVPVCVIAVINVLIIVSLIRVLFATSTMINSSLHKKTVTALRSLGTLVPVLGVTWIFGVLAVNENVEVFQFIFIIANSLQGFFIFISHVVLNKKLIKGIQTQYPSLSGLSMFTESSKKETTSVSRTQSSSSDRPIVKPKTRGILSIFGTSSGKKTQKPKQVIKSDSLLNEKTITTDYSYISPHEKVCLMSSENALKEKETKFE
ncbi:adhesion G protein-coupled receptor L2-like [Saccostrea echinata]|uniref:adhesion G protein-coupled receptor L2-like n=1 Tax=Saccostrea echinata TaxID=191078 RepID=UPI002A8340B5|nr:adhesion G protein-coupled receptor L2-like [Saccostrea echinata]